MSLSGRREIIEGQAISRTRTRSAIICTRCGADVPVHERPQHHLDAALCGRCQIETSASRQA